MSHNPILYSHGLMTRICTVVVLYSCKTYCQHINKAKLHKYSLWWVGNRLWLGFMKIPYPVFQTRAILLAEEEALRRELSLSWAHRFSVIMESLPHVNLDAFARCTHHLFSASVLSFPFSPSFSCLLFLTCLFFSPSPALTILSTASNF